MFSLFIIIVRRVAKAIQISNVKLSRFEIESVVKILYNNFNNNILLHHIKSLETHSKDQLKQKISKISLIPIDKLCICDEFIYSSFPNNLSYIP